MNIKNKVYKDFEKEGYNVKSLSLNYINSFKEIKTVFDSYLEEIGSCRMLPLKDGHGNVLALALELKEWDIAKYIVSSKIVDIYDISCDSEGNTKSAVDYILECIETARKEEQEILGELLNVLKDENIKLKRS